MAKAWVCSVRAHDHRVELVGVVVELAEVAERGGPWDGIAAALVDRRLGDVAERHDVLGGDVAGGWTPPRPPTPIMAMFSFSLRFRPRTIAGAAKAPAAAPATACPNCRRVGCADSPVEKAVSPMIVPPG